MKGLDFEKILLKEKSKSTAESNWSLWINAIADLNKENRLNITRRLYENNPPVVENNFKFDILETNKIFHINQIKKVCIDYRMRFLDSNLFKNEIPEEAISKINLLEKKHQTTLDGFKIMAPSKSFHLMNYDDPLLFAPIGNGYYYLIHKWGNEMTTFRKLLVAPIKNMMNFVVFCLLISLVLTWITPTSQIGKTIPMASVIVFLFIFKSIIAVAAYYFFMLGKNFNSEIWQRKYYNN